MRQTDFYDFEIEDHGTGHIDMLFWNFIQISEIPCEVLKSALNFSLVFEVVNL